MLVSGRACLRAERPRTRVVVANEHGFRLQLERAEPVAVDTDTRAACRQLQAFEHIARGHYTDLVAVMKRTDPGFELASPRIDDRRIVRDERLACVDSPGRGEDTDADEAKTGGAAQYALPPRC